MEISSKVMRFKERAFREVSQHILPFWLRETQDYEHGGFIGRIDGQNQKHPTAPKGLVLNARILWTFSVACQLFPGNEEYLEAAHRAYHYLDTYFNDPIHGGGFWLLDYQGKPLDTKKLTYAQAFWLYGLSEYASATQDPAAHKKADELFHLLEARTKDAINGGYFEGFDRGWTLDESERLSEKDAVAPKSSNTMLHILEAYTAFLKLTNRDDVRGALANILGIFLDHIIDPQSHQMHLAFDREWNPVTEEVSFGHDIEASWLIIEAARLSGDNALYGRTVEEGLKMVDSVVEQGIASDGSVLYARSEGVVDGDRHWWVQSEGVVGFLNAYQVSGDRNYLEASVKLWDFIDRALVDREHGEWLYRINDSGATYPEDNKVGPWKCPYHNARCCYEVITRISD